MLPAELESMVSSYVPGRGALEIERLFHGFAELAGRGEQRARIAGRAASGAQQL